MKRVVFLLIVSIFCLTGCASLSFHKAKPRADYFCDYCKQVVSPVPNTVPGARLKCSRCGHFLEEGRVEPLESTEESVRQKELPYLRS